MARVPWGEHRREGRRGGSKEGVVGKKEWCGGRKRRKETEELSDTVRKGRPRD